MRSTVAALFILLAISLFASLNHAATQQLMVDHYLTGYSRAGSTVTLDYKLHVTNPGDTSFFNLSLSLAPLPPQVTQVATVGVGYLGPNESTDVTLHVVTAAATDAEQFSRNSLFWQGKFENVEGKTVEFPAKSKHGAVTKK